MSRDALVICLLSTVGLGGLSACPQGRSGPAVNRTNDTPPKTPVDTSPVLAVDGTGQPGKQPATQLREGSSLQAECASTRSMDIRFDGTSTCENPISLDCTPAVYRGTTCGAGNGSDICLRPREHTREDAVFSIVLPERDCCNIRLPWWTKIRAGFGHGAACTEGSQSCAYGKGDKGVTGTVTRGRTPDHDAFWLILETGGPDACGAYEFSVSPCACPTPRMSYED